MAEKWNPEGKQDDTVTGAGTNDEIRGVGDDDMDEFDDSDDLDDEEEDEESTTF